MYKMPGEVVRADSPGILGLSFEQLMGTVAGFMIASWLNLGLVWGLLFAAVGAFVTSKSKGYRRYERLANYVQWFVANRMQEPRGLDPAELYVGGDGDLTRHEQQHGATYVVRTGTAVYTVEKR